MPRPGAVLLGCWQPQQEGYTMKAEIKDGNLVITIPMTAPTLSAGITSPSPTRPSLGATKGPHQAGATAHGVASFDSYCCKAPQARALW